MITRDQKIAEAWRRGQLSYKLKPEQKQLHKAIWDAIHNKHSRHTILASRQIGKSYTDVLVAFEFGLRNPNSVIRFGIPVAAEYKEMYGRSLNHILSDCPRCKCETKEQKDKCTCLDLFPDVKADKTITFKNGSHIKISGVDRDNIDNLRGGAMDLGFLDEASFMDYLEEAYEDVLKPQTKTTDGTIILSGSAPKVLDHKFWTYYDQDRAQGRSNFFTIHDDSSMTPEKIEAMAADYGGITSTKFRREFLCERIVEEELIIIPEWQHVKATCTKTWPRNDLFRFYHKYVAMDLGFQNDFTAGLFAWYDFTERKLIVENEFDALRETTAAIAVKIKAKEAEVFADFPMYRRIGDSNNLQMLYDLSTSHDLSFLPVRKTKAGPDQPTDTKESIINGMVNKVRTFIGEGRLIVNPQCKMLLGCLDNAIWDKTSPSKFARSETYRHFDHLAALIYLVKMLDQHTNPIPVLLGKSQSTHFIPLEARKQPNSNATALGQLFNIKR